MKKIVFLDEYSIAGRDLSRLAHKASILLTTTP